MAAGTGNLILKRGVNMPYNKTQDGGGTETTPVLLQGMPAAQIIGSVWGLTASDSAIIPGYAFDNYPNRLWMGTDKYAKDNTSYTAGAESFDDIGISIEPYTGATPPTHPTINETRPIWMGAEIRAHTPLFEDENNGTAGTTGPYVVLRADWDRPSDYVLATQKAISRMPLRYYSNAAVTPGGPVTPYFPFLQFSGWNGTTDGALTRSTQYLFPSNNAPTVGHVLKINTVAAGSGTGAQIVKLEWGAASSGTMSSFTIAGDTGTAEQVDDGETITFTGGTGIDTVVSSPTTITFNLDLNELTTDTDSVVAGDFLAGVDATDSVSGKFTVGNVLGALSGDVSVNTSNGTATVSATNVKAAAASGTAARVALLDNANTNAQQVKYDADSLTYNTSTNTLTAGVFVGSFTGTATTATNLAGGGQGSIPYQSAAGTTTFLSAGTSGDILTYGGSNAPVWSSGTGSGSPVRATSPTIATPIINTISTTSPSTSGNIYTAVTTGSVNLANSLTTGALTMGGTSAQIQLGNNSVVIGRTGGGTSTISIAENTLSSGQTKEVYIAGSAGNAGTTDVAIATGNGAGSTTIVTLGSKSSGGPTTISLDGDTVITGDLTVSGTTTTVNTETINLADNTITLNSNAPQGTTITEPAGIEVKRGGPTATPAPQPTVALRWNENISGNYYGTDRWQITNDGTNYYNIIAADYYSGDTTSSAPLGTQFIHTLDVKNLNISGNWTITGTVTNNFNLSNGGLVLPYVEGNYHATNPMSNLPEGQIAYDITDNRIVFNQGSGTGTTADATGTLRTIISTGNLTDITQVGTLTNTAFSVADATTVALGTSTNAPTINIGTGAISSGAKTINIGTASTTGSTTAITIGGTGGTTNTTALNSISTTVGGTLGVTGITTLTGALNANGGIAVDTNAFTVADTTGNTSISGTLTVGGVTTLNGNVILGDATADTIALNGVITSSLKFGGSASDTTLTTLSAETTNANVAVTLPNWAGRAVVMSTTETSGYLITSSGNNAQPSWTDPATIVVGGVKVNIQNTVATATRYPIPFLGSNRQVDATDPAASFNFTEGTYQNSYLYANMTGAGTATGTPDNYTNGLFYEVDNTSVGTLFCDYIGATLDCGSYT